MNIINESIVEMYPIPTSELSRVGMLSPKYDSIGGADDNESHCLSNKFL
jgi:hypothetical protein